MKPVCERIDTELCLEIEAAEVAVANADEEERPRCEEELRRLLSGYADRILAVKILDPAMGSGHFLLRACQYLAEQIAANVFSGDVAGATSGDEESTLTFWKRSVAEHCIYGVDANPLAVELAKFRAPDMPFGPRRNDGVRLSLLSGAKDPKRGLQELKRRRKHLTFTPKYAEYITGRIMASQVIHGTSIPHALPSQSRGHGQRAPCRGSAGRTGHLL